MVRDTPPSQDASTHQIWNSYLKEYRRYGPDTKAGRTHGGTDGQTDSAITICLPKFLWGHKNLSTLCSLGKFSCFPYGKKCTAATNFREQLANTLRLFGKHNLIWLTSIRGMFGRCSLFTCKLGLPRILLVSSLRIFREYLANMIQDSKLNMQQISSKHSENMRRTCI